MDRNTDGSQCAPELLDVHGTAKLLGRCIKSTYEMALPGRMKIGGRVRWRADTLIAWLACGCPDVEEFDREFIAREREAHGLQPVA